MLLCIPAGLLLQARARRDPLKHFGFAVFSVGLVCCFLGSWLYHAVRAVPELVDFCERIDHMGIFLLIAGTTTPVAMIAMRGRWRVAVLAGMWIMAGSGILIRALAVPLPDEVATALYIMMGWTGLLSYCELARQLSHRQIRLLWIGGLVYSVGALINRAGWPHLWPGVFGPHELFHLFVMAASAIHFTFMLRVLAPFERPALRPQPASDLVPEPVPA